MLILALGIGANTAIFSVIDSVMLSRLPVKDPQGLVFLTDPETHTIWRGLHHGDRESLTYPEYQYLQDHNQAFSSLLAVSNGTPQVAAVLVGAAPAGTTFQAYVSMASGSYFPTLGVQAILGRTFGAETDRVPNADPVAVISFRYWQHLFGGDPNVLGRKIRLRDVSYAVIGVAPAAFTGETSGLAPDIWVPLSMQTGIVSFLGLEEKPLDKIMWLEVIGRLKPGLGLVQAQASVNATFRQFLEEQVSAVPSDKRAEFLDARLALAEGSRGASTLRGSYGRPLLFLLALVGLLLFSACANVANLLLARATFRQKEIAVRLALGAKPSRIFRQLLTESLLLSALGGAAGLLLAQWGGSLFFQLVGPQVEAHTDARILLFALLSAILAGILCGTAPAWKAARTDLNGMLKGTAAGQGSGLPLGKHHVVVHVSLSLLLLIVAGLFVHSFQKLVAVDPGYDQDHLMVFQFGATDAGYKGPAVGQLCQKLSERIRVFPGVRSVTFSENGLFNGRDTGGPIAIAGYVPPSGQEMEARLDQVGPGYFSTLGIPVLLGREIGPQDAAPGQRVGLINRAMARYYFGDANPIGRHISDTYGLIANASFVVVGVVADAKYASVREETLRRCYVPFANPIYSAFVNAAIEIRSAGDPAALIAAVRAAAREIAPQLPSSDIQTASQRIRRDFAPDRLLAKLAGFFGLLATLLASVGIYGVLSYAVARRTREVGIRVALGARPGDVLWLILKDALLLTSIGVIVGTAVTVGAGKLLGSLLFEISPVDPLVLGSAAALMFIIALAAGYLPARRATRVDPLVALREE